MEKEIYRTGELLEMGYPEEFLMYVYRFPGQKVARKMNPTKSNSPIIYKMSELEKFWNKLK